LVYAIGKGLVIRVFKRFPHKSIVIKHDLPDGKNIYSIYTHVEDIEVKIGDWIDGNTVLARLFNQKELEDSGFGTLNHLHLEIRKSFEDGGRASYASMTIEALNTYCLDPMIFFRTQLK
jgi:murein DD-endopeptidase MepM/ murein hydrolase activator NlpD